MSDYRSTNLKEIGRVITGTTPSSKNPEDFGDHMMFVTPTDFKNYNKYITQTIRNLSSVGCNKLSKRMIPPSSVMVTCIGSDMGKVAINKEPVFTNQQINTVIPDQKKINSNFLYYKLLDEYETLKMLGGDGTAVPIVNKSTFESINIEIPSLHEQETIAEVLSSLDDKIDLLQRQNKTLEQMAETLFRQWFVEEADDKTYRGRLSEICKLPSGYAFKSSSFKAEGKYRLITIKNVQDSSLDITNTSYISDLPANVPAHCFLSHGDILMSLTGNVGRVCRVTTHDLLLNQRVAVVKPSLQTYYEYCLALFSYTPFRIKLEDLARGTAQPNLSPVETINMVVDIPAPSWMQKYHEATSQLFKKSLANQKHIMTLQSIRDTLLPKLMNGTVSISPVNSD